MTGFKAILFDCDGVLLDSEPLGCASIAQAMTAVGVAMTTDEAAALFCGHSAAASLAVIARAGLDPHAVADHADRILFSMFEQEVPLMAGVERVLWGFDVPMAVCSNSLVRRLDRSIARTPLARRFGGHIYSAEQVPAAKPAPDLAFFAAARLGVSPAQAVFVDDNPHGLRCGIGAGCLAIGFVGPTEQRADHARSLAQAGADHVVHGMDELHALLSRLSLPDAA
ncbi:HAD family hydrolase [Paracoccus thiocyanatus]|nr:HAD family phosphatase [Paracoccus thiocyanatus]